VRRHADGDGVLAAGDDLMHVGGARHHHGEGPGPERFGEAGRRLRHFAHPAMQKAWIVQVHDHRMSRRTSLGLEDLAHRRRVLRIRAEAIDRLGGESHELTVAQGLHGALDFYLGCSDNTDQS
jgi:hypothetical protein